jgi:DNA mismatch repair protein MutS2
MYFRDAYHPILYLNNKQKNKLRIRKHWIRTENRIIVISGLTQVEKQSR